MDARVTTKDNFTLVPREDIVRLVAPYEDPVPKGVAAYEVAMELILAEPEIPLICTSPPVEDWLHAAQLCSSQVDVPHTKAGDVYLHSEAELADLAAQLQLPGVNRDRIIRVLAYSGRLDNDMNLFDTLPDEVLTQIASNLDAKSLIFLCATARRFAGLYTDVPLWRQVLIGEGYKEKENKVDASAKALRLLCLKNAILGRAGSVYVFGKGSPIAAGIAPLRRCDVDGTVRHSLISALGIPTRVASFCV